MDPETKALIEAALALADSLTWDISDSGNAGVECDYDAASALLDAVTAFRNANGLPVPNDASRQAAIRGLASLIRR